MEYIIIGFLLENDVSAVAQWNDHYMGSVLKYHCSRLSMEFPENVYCFPDIKLNILR